MAKDTIVLLPGYDGDGDKTFAQLVQLIKNDFNCIVVNYPYFRQTERAYSTPDLIAYIHSLVEAKHLTKVHLLGFSMGGFIATGYALNYPKSIISLNLISSSIKPQLSIFYRFCLQISYYAFKIPTLAKLFSFLYTSKMLRPLTKKSPLPLPRPDFPSKEGYPVFGTLANVMHQTLKSMNEVAIKELEINKIAILFKDDLSFPSDNYYQLLANSGFKVIVKERGGHAISTNYWNLVAQNLYQ